MKKGILPFSALCILLFFSFVSFGQQRAKYVVLVTIDGLRPEFYLNENWGMPNLRFMMQNGVAVKEAVPVYPSVTYPNHTTLVTGVVTARHGIYHNGPFSSKGRTLWYWFYDSVKVKTLFEAMRDAGKKTASILWPVTVNAPIDYNIPPITNPETKDRTMAINYVRPRSLWQEVQDSATGVLKPEDWDITDGELLWDENIGRAAAYIIKQYRPGFLALHLVMSDHSQHSYGRDHYMTKAAVSGADRSLRTILEAVNRAGIADSTAIIVTGDHGFANVYRRFNPNILLKRNKLFEDEQHWKAVFFASGASSFLYLKDKQDKTTLKAVKKLLTQLPDSIKQYFQVIDKERLERAGADPSSALALSGLKGTTVGNSSDGELIEAFKSVKGQHGLFPDHAEMYTGFVGYGAGFKKGVIVDRIELLDVAPIIVGLTGIDFPPRQLKKADDLLKKMLVD